MKFHPFKICIVDDITGKEVIEDKELKKSYKNEFKYIDFRKVDFTIKYFSIHLNKNIYLGDMFIHKKTRKIFTFSLFPVIHVDKKDIYRQGISSFGFTFIKDNKSNNVKIKSQFTFKELSNQKTFFKNLLYIGNIFRPITIDKNILSLDSLIYHNIHSEITNSKNFIIISEKVKLNFSEIKSYTIPVLKELLIGNFNILINYKNKSLSGQSYFSNYTGDIFELKLSINKFKEYYFDYLNNNENYTISIIKNKLKDDNDYLNKSIDFYKKFLIYLNDDGEVIQTNGVRTISVLHDDDLFSLTTSSMDFIYNYFTPMITIGYKEKMLEMLDLV